MKFQQKGLWSKAALALGAATTLGVVPNVLMAQEAEVKVTARVDESEGEDKTVAEVQVESPKYWLGISLKPIEGDLASYLGSADGVLVDTVYPDSPAEKVGLKAGDILTAVNGKPLTTPKSLLEQMVSIKADNDGKVDPLKFEYIRKGEKKSVELTPIARPENMTITVNGKKIEGNSNDHAFDFKFNIDTDELLSKLQDVSKDAEGFKIFRFGTPSEVLVPGKQESKDGESRHENKQRIEVRMEVDGKLNEINISRDGDAPAKITIKHNGETKEYSEKDLNAIPESLRSKVKELLASKPGAKHGESRVEIRRMKGNDHSSDGGQSGAVVVVGPNDDLTKKHKEMAEKIAERAKAAAKAARDRALEMPKELSELRSQIEALKAEVEELKNQIGKK
jgi:membrane-associated protease RseP (regulator of RpoE activity)